MDLLRIEDFLGLESFVSEKGEYFISVNVIIGAFVKMFASDSRMPCLPLVSRTRPLNKTAAHSQCTVAAKAERIAKQEYCR
jgi:hypothetical protein